MKICRLLIIAVAIAPFAAAFCVTRSALAGPPFITDDPDPTEYQHWEVYCFSIYNHASNSDAAQIPAVEINYGLVPDVQVHLVAPIGYNSESGETANYGYADTELGIKYRFVKETDSVPEIGIFPLVELPTGDSNKRLGNGKAQVFLPLWLQKSFGKDKEWTTFGGGGFWYNPGEGNRNFVRVGWELQRNLSEHLTLGAEIFHESSAADGEPGHTAFNIGGYYNFNDHNHLLASVGRDFDGPTHFTCYLGYQWTF